MTIFTLLIKTEDEVDAEAEDSAVADALADADKTEIQKLQTTSGNAKVRYRCLQMEQGDRLG